MHHSTKYALKKLLYAIPILIGISFLAFILGYISKGDPATVLLTADPDYLPTAEEILALQTQMGINDPIWQQYGRWIIDIVHGDLGTSLITNRSVLTEMQRLAPNTLILAGTTLLVVIVCGLTGGILLAHFHNSVFDYIGRCVLVALMSLPGFCMAYLLIWLFAQKLKILPTSGTDNWLSYIMPCAVLSIGSACVVARLLRGSILNEKQKHYSLTATAKGLSPWQVLINHNLRNSLNPTITYSANIFGGLLGGSMIIESIFAVPGLGSYALSAISSRDYVALQGYVLYTGCVYVLVCLLADIICAYINPQINLEV